MSSPDQIVIPQKLVEGRPTLKVPKGAERKLLLSLAAAGDGNTEAKDYARQTLQRYCEADLPTVSVNLARDLTTQQLVGLDGNCPILQRRG